MKKIQLLSILLGTTMLTMHAMNQKPVHKAISWQQAWETENSDPFTYCTQKLAALCCSKRLTTHEFEKKTDALLARSGDPLPDVRSASNMRYLQSNKCQTLLACIGLGSLYMYNKQCGC